MFLRVDWTGGYSSLIPLGSQDADGTHTQTWELASNHRSGNIKSCREPDEAVGVFSGKRERGEHKQGTKLTDSINISAMHQHTSGN